MPCYHPLDAARATGSDMTPLIYAKGRRPDPLARGWEALQIPCGQCIGCRLEHSRTWAVRIMHEASLHEDNAFVTLTYDDDHLPVDGCLNKKHFQDFMKRLRKAHAPRTIRFFHCGEYGESYDRPHYHACLFNVHFPDQKIYKREQNNVYYTSAELEKLWGKGYAVIGELTFESAAYVARYVCKKITGPLALEHYMRDHPLTGCVRELTREYATMSRGGRKEGPGGLGAQWFEEYESDVYPWDEVIVRGHPTKPPRYYDKLHEAGQPVSMNRVRQKREEENKQRAENNTPARLDVRERVKKAQVNLHLTRSYEK